MPLKECAGEARKHEASAGTAIKFVRRVRGISQKDLAERVGLSQARVAQIEADVWPAPPVLAEAIWKALSS